MKKKTIVVLVGILLLVGGIRALDYFTVGKPVADALSADSRNSAFSLVAHQRYYVPSGELVLNLRRVEDAAPVDLLRGVFQTAQVFDAQGKVFSRIILANRGKPVFLMEGGSFSELGTQMRYGENPGYMIRKFPSKLFKPDGSSAYGEWTGGLLGVVGREMEDVNDAMGNWAFRREN